MGAGMRDAQPLEDVPGLLGMSGRGNIAADPEKTGLSTVLRVALTDSPPSFPQIFGITDPSTYSPTLLNSILRHAPTASRRNRSSQSTTCCAIACFLTSIQWHGELRTTATR